MNRVACACVAAWLSGLPISGFAQPPVTALAFSPDGAHILAGSQRGVELLRWPSLESVRHISTGLSHVHDMAFSPSGHALLVAGGAPGEYGGYELFAWPSWKLLYDSLEHEDAVYAVDWAADGSQFATAAGDEQMTTWDAQTGEPRYRFAGHSRRVLAIAVVPTTELIVSAGVDQTLRVWDRSAGKLVRLLDNHTDIVRDLAARPGEPPLPIIASASADRTVRLWQPTIGRLVRFARLPAEPLSIAWTIHGERLAIACTDGHVRVIDPESLATVLDERVIDGWAYEVAVAPNGRELAVAGTELQIRRVALPPASE